MRIVVIGRDILMNNAQRPIACPEPFWQVGLWTDSRFFDYSGADFSFTTFLSKFGLFQSVLILLEGLFLVVIRLVHLFPLQILDGNPSTKQGAEQFVKGFFLYFRCINSVTRLTGGTSQESHDVPAHALLSGASEELPPDK